jgi:hypothetical protein
MRLIYNQKLTAIPAPALSDDALKHFQQSISLIKLFHLVMHRNGILFHLSTFRKFLETTYPSVHQN